MMPTPITAIYRFGASAARLLPLTASAALARWAAPILALVMGSRRVLVERHQHRALSWRARLECEANSADPADSTGSADPVTSNSTPRRIGLMATRRSTRAAFESYARYWLESFRLPALAPSVLDAGLELVGWSQVRAGLESGNGVILALPHLGGWEWGGFWITAVDQVPINVVVEPLEPPDLFEWFVSFRRTLGMNVIPLGPGAGAEVLAALKRNEIVCLLCDRDLGDGIEVDFMGEPTTLPAGPALLALRSGATVLPSSVYFAGRGGHLAYVRPPLNTERTGTLRQDVKRVTQDLADELGLLIAAAPHQWHMFNPNWPSDS